MWGYWLFFALESLIVNIMLPADELAFSDSTYLILIVVNSVVLICVILIKYSHDSDFVKLLIIAFVFRMALLFWSEYFSYIFTLPNSGADEMTYYYNAMSNLVKDKEFTGYALLFSWQARVFGLSKLYGKFVNVLFSISSITILRKILIRLDIDRTARIKTMIFACLLPNYAILSSLLLRESIIIFLIAVSLYFFICWWKDGGICNALIAAVVSLGAAWLHSGMIAYTMGIICIFVSAKKTVNGHKLKLLSLRTVILSIITSVIVLFVLLNTDLGFSDYFRDADSIQDIVSIADAYEDGGSAYNANIVNNDSTIGFIINTPIRMFFFLFAPVPWQWRSATDAVAFLFSALFYSYIFFKTIYFMKKNKETSLISALFLIALLALMMFGWGVSNSGTALRHRDKMVIHYLIMYAIFQNKKCKRFNSGAVGSYYYEV